MPGMNQTGPNGMGPRTGRGMGICGGANAGALYGRGRGGMPRGCGNGWGGGRGRFQQTLSPDDERVMLVNRKQALTSEAEAISTRLNELTKKSE